MQSEAEETLSITSRFISFRSAYLKIYDKERDTDMRKLLSLAAALAAAGALSIGASANGGVVGGVVRAGEDVVNGVVDAGEDIVNGVTGTANGANGANGTTTAPGNPNTGVPFSMAAVGAAALGLAGVALSCRKDG